MKLYKFGLTAGICLTGVLLFMYLLDDAIFVRQYHTIHGLDSFYVKANDTYKSYYGDARNFSDDSLQSDTQSTGQTLDPQRDYDAYYLYQLKSTRNGLESVFPINAALILLDDMADIFHISPLIVGAIITFILVSLAVASIYFIWGRKP